MSRSSNSTQVGSCQTPMFITNVSLTVFFHLPSLELSCLHVLCHFYFCKTGEGVYYKDRDGWWNMASPMSSVSTSPSVLKVSQIHLSRVRSLQGRGRETPRLGERRWHVLLSDSLHGHLSSLNATCKIETRSHIVILNVVEFGWIDKK